MIIHFINYKTDRPRRDTMLQWASDIIHVDYEFEAGSPIPKGVFNTIVSIEDYEPPLDMIESTVLRFLDINGVVNNNFYMVFTGTEFAKLNNRFYLERFQHELSRGIELNSNNSIPENLVMTMVDTYIKLCGIELENISHIDGALIFIFRKTGHLVDNYYAKLLREVCRDTLKIVKE